MIFDFRNHQSKITDYNLMQYLALFKCFHSTHHF